MLIRSEDPSADHLGIVDPHLKCGSVCPVCVSGTGERDCPPAVAAFAAALLYFANAVSRLRQRSLEQGDEGICNSSKNQ